MSDGFSQRVRAAASAGWRTVLVFWLLLIGSWVLTMTLMRYEPAWVLKLIGERMTWDELGKLYIDYFAIMKTMVLALLIVTVYLTFWSKRLGRSAA